MGRGFLLENKRANLSVGPTFGVGDGGRTYCQETTSYNNIWEGD